MPETSVLTTVDQVFWRGLDTLCERWSYPIWQDSRRFPHHSLAFRNIRSHGDAFKVFFHSSGIQGHCHVRNVRSGWGMIARWRPSGEHIAAIALADPFGLKGYCIVGSRRSSTYRTGASDRDSTLSRIAFFGK